MTLLSTLLSDVLHSRSQPSQDLGEVAACVCCTTEETEAWGLADWSKASQLERGEWDSSPGPLAQAEALSTKALAAIPTDMEAGAGAEGHGCSLIPPTPAGSAVSGGTPLC